MRLVLTGGRVSELLDHFAVRVHQEIGVRR